MILKGGSDGDQFLKKPLKSPLYAVSELFKAAEKLFKNG